MNRRQFLPAVLAVPALAAAGVALKRKSFALLTPRMSSQKAGNFTYSTYTVTDPVAFLALTFPVGMLFWGGMLLLPGIQYDLLPGGGCRLRKLPLVAGETITVVST